MIAVALAHILVLVVLNAYIFREVGGVRGKRQRGWEQESDDDDDDDDEGWIFDVYVDISSSRDGSRWCFFQFGFEQQQQQQKQQIK